jgi:hypothetical protein
MGSLEREISTNLGTGIRELEIYEPVPSPLTHPLPLQTEIRLISQPNNQRLNSEITDAQVGGGGFVWVGIRSCSLESGGTGKVLSPLLLPRESWELAWGWIFLLLGNWGLGRE